MKVRGEAAHLTARRSSFLLNSGEEWPEEMADKQKLLFCLDNGFHLLFDKPTRYPDSDQPNFFLHKP